METNANTDLMIEIGVSAKEFNRGLEKMEQGTVAFYNYITSLSEKYQIKAAKKELSLMEKTHIEKQAMIKESIKEAEDQYEKLMKLEEDMEEELRVKLFKDEKAFNDKKFKEEKANQKRIAEEAERNNAKILKDAKDLADKIEQAQIQANLASWRKKDAIIQKEAKERKEVIRELRTMGVQFAEQTATETLKLFLKTEKQKTKFMLAEQKRRAKYSMNLIKQEEARKAGKKTFGESTALVMRYGLISQGLYGIQAGMLAAGRATIEFNNSLYQNMAVLNTTNMESQQLISTVKQLGVAYGGTFDEIQEGLITLGRAGVDSVPALREATKVIKELSMITGDSMREGAEIMSSMINVYGKSEGFDVKNLGDQLAYVANATRLGIEDFSTISNYALTAAESLGMTKESFLALAGAMSKVGTNASTIGTNIRRLQKLISDDSEANLEFFRILGVEQSKFAGMLRDDSDEAMGQFIARLSEMNTDEFAAATKDLNILIKQMVVSFRSIGSKGYFSGILADITKARGGMGDLSDQAALMSQGLGKMMEQAKNQALVVLVRNLERVGNALGSTTSKGALKDFGGELETITDNLTYLIEDLIKFGGMIGYIFPSNWATKGKEEVQIFRTELELTSAEGVRLTDEFNKLAAEQHRINNEVGGNLFGNRNENLKEAGDEMRVIYNELEKILKKTNELSKARFKQQSGPGWKPMEAEMSDKVLIKYKKAEILLDNIAKEYSEIGYNSELLLGYTEDYTKLVDIISKNPVIANNQKMIDKRGEAFVRMVTQLEKLTKMETQHENASNAAKKTSLKLTNELTQAYADQAVLAGDMTKEQKESLVMYNKQVEVGKDYMDAVQRTAELRNEDLTIVENQLALDEARNDEATILVQSIELSNEALSLGITHAASFRDKIKQSSDEAYTLAINLQNAVNALASALRGQQVLSGQMNSAQKSYLDHAQEIDALETKRATTAKQQGNLLNELASGNLSIAETAEAARAYEQKGLDLKTESTAILQENNKWTSETIALNKEGLKVSEGIELTAIRTAYAKNKISNSDQKQLNTARMNIALAKKELSLVKEGETYGIGNTDVYDTNRSAAVQKVIAAEQQLGYIKDTQATRRKEEADAQAKRDAAAAKRKAAAARKAGAAAKRAAKAVDKAGKDRIRMLVLESKIAKERTKQAAYGIGVALTENQLMKLDLETQTLIVAQAQEAYDLSLEEVSGTQSNVAAKTAQLSLEKEITKQSKLQAEYDERFADTFDALFSGEWESAFEGIAESLQDAFGIQDIGKAWSTLFSKLVDSGKMAALDIEAAFMSTGWYLLITVGMKALESMLSGSTVTAAQTKAAEGITGVESNTVENSIEILAANSELGLAYSSRMADSLDALVASSDKAAAEIGLKYSGEDYQPNNKDGIWGSTERELTRSGITLAPSSIKDINDGNMKAYNTTVEKVTKGSWFGMKKDESYSESMTPMEDQAVLQPIMDAYKSGYDSIKEAAMAFGMTIGEFETFTAAWTTSLADLNFAGKTEQEISDMITGVIGKDMDALAGMLTSITPYIEGYAKAGEDQGETLMRLVADYEMVDRMFSDLGVEMMDLTDGGVALSQALIDAAGGADKLNASMRTYLNTMYTEAERTEILHANLTSEFQMQNMILPTTIDQYKNLVAVQTAEAMTTAQLTEDAWALVVSLKEAGGAAYDLAVEEHRLAKIRSDAAADDLAFLYSRSGDWGSVFDTADEKAAAAAAAQEEAARAAEQASEEAKRAAEDAQRAAEAAAEAWRRMLLDIASLQAAWMEDLPGAQNILDATIADTGLTGLTNENFLEEFNKAVAAGMTPEDLEGWNAMSSALQGLQSAIDAAADEADEKMQEQIDLLQEQVDFYQDVLNTINDAYMGALSYLSSEEKANYAGQMADDALAAGDTQGYFDALGEQLEYEKRMSVTKEEYIPKFEEYIDKLKEAEPEADTDDVVDELEAVNAKLNDVIDAIEKASYQS